MPEIVDDTNNNVVVRPVPVKAPPPVDTDSGEPIVLVIAEPTDPAGIESNTSYSLDSPGADSMGSIISSPPTPKLTAHELALLGSSHSFTTTPKIDSNNTPWFYKSTWRSLLKAKKKAPSLGRHRHCGKEIIIWLFVLLLVVVLLCVVVPVIWFKSKSFNSPFAP